MMNKTVKTYEEMKEILPEALKPSLHEFTFAENVFMYSVMLGAFMVPPFNGITIFNKKEEENGKEDSCNSCGVCRDFFDHRFGRKY